MFILCGLVKKDEQKASRNPESFQKAEPAATTPKTYCGACGQDVVIEKKKVR
jgi:hypothetical protein